MFCSRCGAQSPEGQAFCPSCGQPIGPAQAPIPPVTTTTPNFMPPIPVRAQTGRWIGAGWDMVKADLGGYLVISLLFFVISSVVPFIQGPLLAGFYIYVMKRMLGRRAEIGDLFKGFDFFVHSLVASLLIGIFVFAGTLACIVPGLVLAAMYSFSYLFIVDKRMEFWPAMQASHAVVKNDYVGFTLFILCLGLINLLGILLCFVGALFTLPISIAATTVAYREIVGFDPRTAATV